MLFEGVEDRSFIAELSKNQGLFFQSSQGVLGDFPYSAAVVREGGMD